MAEKKKTKGKAKGKSAKAGAKASKAAEREESAARATGTTTTVTADAAATAAAAAVPAEAEPEASPQSAQSPAPDVAMATSSTLQSSVPSTDEVRSASPVPALGADSAKPAEDTAASATAAAAAAAAAAPEAQPETDAPLEAAPQAQVEQAAAASPSQGSSSRAADEKADEKVADTAAEEAEPTAPLRLSNPLVGNFFSSKQRERSDNGACAAYRLPPPRDAPVSSECSCSQALPPRPRWTSALTSPTSTPCLCRCACSRSRCGPWRSFSRCRCLRARMSAPASATHAPGSAEGPLCELQGALPELPRCRWRAVPVVLLHRCSLCSAACRSRRGGPGYLNCPKCINDLDVAVIPGLALTKFDVKRCGAQRSGAERRSGDASCGRQRTRGRSYPVCKRAAEYLSGRAEIPNISISAVNPNIFKNNKELRCGRACACVLICRSIDGDRRGRKARSLRQQLAHIKPFIITCRQSALLLEVVGDLDYMMDSDDLYSVRPRPRALTHTPAWWRVVTLSHRDAGQGFGRDAERAARRQGWWPRAGVFSVRLTQPARHQLVSIADRLAQHIVDGQVSVARVAAHRRAALRVRIVFRLLFQGLPLRVLQRQDADLCLPAGDCVRVFVRKVGICPLTCRGYRDRS